MESGQLSRQNRGCIWEGGGCVFCDTHTGGCNLYDDIDWPISYTARTSQCCEANYTASEMRVKLGI
jgi:hypothetical protein